MSEEAKIREELREIKVALVCLCELFARVATTQHMGYTDGKGKNVNYMNIMNEYFEAADGKETKK